ncbi:MAG: hypothetical protein H8D45_19280, partial [Bacteroidetes bacterium]|nr:hypothetical protein [Bacteroidota bacterium]
FNSNTSKVHKKHEGKMLWSVILFAENIGWSSGLAFLISHKHYFEFCDDRFKVDTYKYYVKFWNTSVTPKQIEDNYNNYIKTKKKRNKIKEELKLYAKCHAFMNALEKEMIKLIDANERDLGIKELIPFMCLIEFMEDKENEIIALAYFIPFKPKVNREITDLYLIYNMTSAYNEIPMFSNEIDKILSYKEFGVKTKKDFFAKGKTNAFRELFLEFASPESLTSKQVEIIRNELNEKFKEITDGIEELNKAFLEKKLKADNLEEIKTSFTDKLKPRVSEFQNAIDNNIYMIQLKNKEDKPKIYKLYLVLTTVRNIVGLYEKLNIINQGSALYCREELQQKGVLDVLKFFLYLKVEGE